MNLSSRQKNELEVWKYFIPDNCAWAEETPQDIEMFFKWSEHGEKNERIGKYGDLSFASALYWGKKWAYIHVHEMWERDFSAQDGSWMGYYDLVKDMPRPVVNFIKKEMFKGNDAEVIERCKECQTLNGEF